MDRYRVLITGSRHWDCARLALSIVTRLKDRHGAGLVIVHGNAAGVDAAFREACILAGVEHEPHPADWNAHGRVAGPIRNSEMVQAGADVCLAFSPDLAKSRGTRDCVSKAIRAGIPTWLIDKDDGPETKPKRLEDI